MLTQRSAPDPKCKLGYFIIPYIPTFIKLFPLYQEFCVHFVYCYYE